METVVVVGTLLIFEAIAYGLTGIRILSEWGFSVVS